MIADGICSIIQNIEFEQLGIDCLSLMNIIMVKSLSSSRIDSMSQQRVELLSYLADNNIAIMHRPKYQPANHHDSIRNPENFPRIPVKRAVNVRKRIIGGQQSAQQANRNPQRQMIHRESELSPPSLQQIQGSAIYRLLQEQMRVMASRHEVELSKMREIKQQRARQLDQLKKEQFSTKMQIWELKNEVMELKESIKEEKDETVRLRDELNIEAEAEDELGALSPVRS